MVYNRRKAAMVSGYETYKFKEVSLLYLNDYRRFGRRLLRCWFKHISSWTKEYYKDYIRDRYYLYL